MVSTASGGSVRLTGLLTLPADRLPDRGQLLVREIRHDESWEEIGSVATLGMDELHGLDDMSPVDQEAAFERDDGGKLAPSLTMISSGVPLISGRRSSSTAPTSRLIGALRPSAISAYQAVR